ncbi:MAG: CehA/McbA family metallohydrolase [Alphaproteobacteria bacterium]
MRLLLLSALAVLLAAPAFAGAIIAEQITTQNADQHIQDGPDAHAGVGDWALSNGVICATISNINRESDLAATGGALSDVGFCDRADDNIQSFHDLIGDTPVRAERIEAYSGTESAKITVYGNAPGMVTKTTYTVSTDAPQKIKIAKSYRITGDVGAIPMIPHVWMNYYSLTPYMLNLADPARSPGTALKAFVGRSPTDIADYAQHADLMIATSPHDDVPVSAGGSGRAIAYGWRQITAMRHMPDGSSETLPVFGLSEPAATAFASFTNAFWFEPTDGKLGLLQLLQMAIMAPDEGDVLTFEEELLIGDRADAAAITDQVYDGAPVTGRLARADLDSVVHFETADGAPITYVRPNAAGAFAARLPAGSYQMIVKAAGADEYRQSFDHHDSPQALGVINSAVPARLLLPRNSGPMRLTILGAQDTPTPDLANQQLGLTVSDADGLREKTPMPYVYLAGIAADPAHVDLAPGTYRVLASRGLEFSVEEASLTLNAGETTTLVIEAPRRAVDSPNMMGADFHTHSAPSLDTVMATGDRVTSFIAEGGEIMVAAEHETIFDYRPVLNSLDLFGRVIVVNGTEITSEVATPRNPYTIGHANAFPLTVKRDRWRRGQPMNEARRWRDVIADTRASWPNTIMQLNHPTVGDKVEASTDGNPQESAGSRGFFLDHMGPVGRQFDPAKPLTDPHNQNLIDPDPVTGYRDLDFDAVELLNGPWFKSYRMMREMWISWLKQGEYVVGVANSDSHTKAELIGWPRNMVMMGIDDIAAYHEADFVAAVKAGKIIGTTGPIVSVSLNGAGPGDQIAADSGTLTVSVAAADWVADPTGSYELRISVNGEQVHQGRIGSRESQNHDLTFAQDAFVLVEVEGAASDTYKIIAPRHHPLAFSNPIFVDADRDGAWTPPGL